VVQICFEERGLGAERIDPYLVETPPMDCSGSRLARLFCVFVLLSSSDFCVLVI
jgi:hypothetical protein